MHNFRNLQVWQKSRELVKDVYNLTSQLPKEEIYGLTSQIKRSSVSISANIAEGSGRNTNKDFINFLSHSQGSACELESHLMIALDLNFLSSEDISSTLSKLEEIQKMNRAFQDSLLNKL